MQHDVFRPNAGGRFRAVLDERGYPLAVQHASPGSRCSAPCARAGSIRHRKAPGTRAWSMASTIRAIGCRIFWWRPSIHRCRSRSISCAPSARPRRVFFWESFITELAHRARIDQYHYRRNLLSHDPLALRVLDAAARASDWGRTQNTFGGIAYNCYVGRGGRFKTYVAEVVELARVAGRFVVKRVLCAVDPGLVVNPNTLKAQIEGGIGFALTNTLKSRITFSNGGAEQATSPIIHFCASMKCRRSCQSCSPATVPHRASGKWCWRRLLPRWRRPCFTRRVGQWT